MLKGIVISAVLTFLWITAQIAIVHLRKPRRFFALLCALFSSTVPLYPLLYLLTPADLFVLPPACARSSDALGIVTGLVAHLLFFFAYVEVFYYVERSVTLRMLVEVARRPGCGIDDLRSHYRVETMVEERLNAMRGNGFIGLSEGVWRLTRRGRCFARVCILSRRVLNLGPGQ